MNFQAKITSPVGVLGIRCDERVLLGINFLSANEPLSAPACAISREIVRQLAQYFTDAQFKFDVPLADVGTSHQRKVWQAMCAIPCGAVKTYGELATELHSAAQAVGQACGANPIPIVIPCHRVLAKTGMGGFMNQRSGAALNIKQWLLAHEQR
jgi:methylated-DNA-[protein]-cysteine S-methyltransferase